MQMIPYKLKLNIKIGRYPTIPFMVIRFKERNLQRRILNSVRIVEIEILRISVF